MPTGADTETPELRALINDFAVRSFRDTADGDYIVARMAHRAGLVPQFLWSSLQAIEKYLKGILLLNRVPSVKATHGVADLLEKAEAVTKLRLRLSKYSKEFVSYLDTYGRFRYLEISYHASGKDLVRLDRAVWEIRRYCAVLDYSRTESGAVVSMLENELRLLERAEENPRGFQAFGGYLEKIISDPRHPARPALLWKNLLFGPSKRRRIKMSDWYTSVNAPLALNPEVFAEVRKYVYLPKPMIEEFERLLKTNPPQ
ncbi:MAG: HEPN domain-containing protein [Candidatus Solibacter sp.]